MNNKNIKMKELKPREVLMNYFTSSVIIQHCFNYIGDKDVERYCKEMLEDFEERGDSVSALEALNEMELECLKELHAYRLTD